MKKNLWLFSFFVLMALIMSHVAHCMENYPMLGEGKRGYGLRLIYNREELNQILPNELALFAENETLFLQNFC